MGALLVSILTGAVTMPLAVTLLQHALPFNDDNPHISAFLLIAALAGAYPYYRHVVVPGLDAKQSGGVTSAAHGFALGFLPTMVIPLAVMLTLTFIRYTIKHVLVLLLIAAGLIAAAYGALRFFALRGVSGHNLGLLDQFGIGRPARRAIGDQSALTNLLRQRFDATVFSPQVLEATGIGAVVAVLVTLVVRHRLQRSRYRQVVLPDGKLVTHW